MTNSTKLSKEEIIRGFIFNQESFNRQAAMWLENFVETLVKKSVSVDRIRDVIVKFREYYAELTQTNLLFLNQLDKLNADDDKNLADFAVISKKLQTLGVEFDAWLDRGCTND